MRKLTAAVLAVAFLTAGGLTAKGDAPRLDGRWKLSALQFGDDEYLIFDVRTVNGRPNSMVATARPALGLLETAEIVTRGDEITIDIPAAAPLSFRGTFRGGKALGTLKYKGSPLPARVEKTAAEALAPLRPSPFREAVARAQAEEDPKRRVDRLNALIQKNRGQPVNAVAYAPMIAAAVAAGLPPGEVRGHVNAWVAESEPYGPEWTGEIQERALKALEGKKAYAGVATELAQAAEKALPADAPLDLRGSLATMLATSARLAGKDDLAAAAESRAREIDAKLDAEYHDKVPPFRSATFTGRKNARGNHAVVMEIFSGAQCPPCVAADVAFDALLTTYKPTEFIGLQYHLHVPGPDPLTNPDSLARQKYYDDEVQGMPSALFDGRSAADGGGGMQGSEKKYHEYRDQIDPALETEAKAEIKLTADRAGDEITIAARATAKDAPRDAKPRLRLVLVEHSVRYTGGNKLRFHHNVVRAFPGGVDGKALADGKGEVKATVKLSELRKSLASYLDEFPQSGRSFPNPLPPIDLDDLAVVALVQDDADKAIWQGVQVPVKAVNP